MEEPLRMALNKVQTLEALVSHLKGKDAARLKLYDALFKAANGKLNELLQLLTNCKDAIMALETVRTLPKLCDRLNAKPG